MVRLQELIETLSDQSVEDRVLDAKDNQICKICGGPAETFKSDLTKVEYAISLICEKCQEYFYLNEESN